MATAHLIVSALVRREGRILLVSQRAPDDAEPHWMLPGGQGEAGETLIEALRRELLEETGMRLTGDPLVAFVVHVVGAGDSHVAITFACDAEGEVAPDDPDGYVQEAAWVAEVEALSRLAQVAWYEIAPLRELLNGGPPGAVRAVDRR